MTKHLPKVKPQKAPHPGDLIKVIRRLADAGKMSFNREHTFERMEERFEPWGFDLSDVLKILREGKSLGKLSLARKLVSGVVLLRANFN